MAPNFTFITRIILGVIFAYSFALRISPALAQININIDSSYFLTNAYETDPFGPYGLINKSNIFDIDWKPDLNLTSYRLSGTGKQGLRFTLPDCPKPQHSNSFGSIYSLGNGIHDFLNWQNKESGRRDMGVNDLDRCIRENTKSVLGGGPVTSRNINLDAVCGQCHMKNTKPYLMDPSKNRAFLDHINKYKKRIYTKEKLTDLLLARHEVSRGLSYHKNLGVPKELPVKCSQIEAESQNLTCQNKDSKRKIDEMLERASLGFKQRGNQLLSDIPIRLKGEETITLNFFDEIMGKYEDVLHGDIVDFLRKTIGNITYNELHKFLNDYYIRHVSEHSIKQAFAPIKEYRFNPEENQKLQNIHMEAQERHSKGQNLSVLSLERNQQEVSREFIDGVLNPTYLKLLNGACEIVIQNTRDLCEVMENPEKYKDTFVSTRGLIEDLASKNLEELPIIDYTAMACEILKISASIEWNIVGPHMANDTHSQASPTAFSDSFARGNAYLFGEENLSPERIREVAQASSDVMRDQFNQFNTRKSKSNAKNNNDSYLAQKYGENIPHSLVAFVNSPDYDDGITGDSKKNSHKNSFKDDAPWYISQTTQELSSFNVSPVAYDSVTPSMDASMNASGGASGRASNTNDGYFDFGHEFNNLAKGGQNDYVNGQYNGFSPLFNNFSADSGDLNIGNDGSLNNANDELTTMREHNRAMQAELNRLKNERDEMRNSGKTVSPEILKRLEALEARITQVTGQLNEATKLDETMVGEGQRGNWANLPPEVRQQRREKMKQKFAERVKEQVEQKVAELVPTASHDDASARGDMRGDTRGDNGIRTSHSATPIPNTQTANGGGMGGGLGTASSGGSGGGRTHGSGSGGERDSGINYAHSNGLVLTYDVFQQLSPNDLRVREGEILRVREITQREDGVYQMSTREYKVVDSIPLPIDEKREIVTDERGGRVPASIVEDLPQGVKTYADLRRFEREALENEQARLRHQELIRMLEISRGQ